MTVARPFRGPVIDRDVFVDTNGLATLPERFSSSVPYFDVIRDRDPLGPRYRFWFEPERGGWVWDPKWPK